MRRVRQYRTRASRSETWGTGATQVVSADAQGRFRVPGLLVGDYEVQVSKVGFSTVVRKGITLTVTNNGMGSTTGSSLGIEAIGEFQTLTNTYGAQFGGNRNYEALLRRTGSAVASRRCII
jgi:hypothetical protein